jgi:hypothetical protein
MLMLMLIRLAPVSFPLCVQRDARSSASAGSGYAASVGIGRRGKAADLHARFDFLGRRTLRVARVRIDKA